MWYEFFDDVAGGIGVGALCVDEVWEREGACGDEVSADEVPCDGVCFEEYGHGFGGACYVECCGA